MDCYLSEYTMIIILVVATVIAVLPPLLVLMMKDIRLDDRHNEIEGRGTDGLSIHESESDYDMKK